MGSTDYPKSSLANIPSYLCLLQPLFYFGHPENPATPLDFFITNTPSVQTGNKTNKDPLKMTVAWL